MHVVFDVYLEAQTNIRVNEFINLPAGSCVHVTCEHNAYVSTYWSLYESFNY